MICFKKLCFSLLFVSLYYTDAAFGQIDSLTDVAFANFEEGKFREAALIFEQILTSESESFTSYNENIAGIAFTAMAFANALDTVKTFYYIKKLVDTGSKLPLSIMNDERWGSLRNHVEFKSLMIKSQSLQLDTIYTRNIIDALVSDREIIVFDSIKMFLYSRLGQVW